MSEQLAPMPAEVKESPSGLLLSVEPLREGAKLYATDTLENTTDPSDDTADQDELSEDTDKSDTMDDDGPPADEEAEQDHPPSGDDSDSDSTDKLDDDGSTTEPYNPPPHGLDTDGIDAI